MTSPRNGVDTPLANSFVTAARPIPPEAEGAKRARSASEAFLYRRLETLRETSGRFQMKRRLTNCVPWLGQEWKSIPLCADSRLVVESDGSQHLAGTRLCTGVTGARISYLQENGYLVLRYTRLSLAERALVQWR